MKIGIATPIHRNDIKYRIYLRNAIKELKTNPYRCSSFINDGEMSLAYYRTFLFDMLFMNGCDIVLQCSVDHYIHSRILDYVAEDKVTTFAYLKLKPSYFIDFIRFKLSPDMWTGCYSITKEFWGYFKGTSMHEVWDGEDYAIVAFAEEIGYPIKRIRKPLYTLLNPSNII